MRDERGQGTVEYLGVLVVVAVLLAGIALTGLPKQLAHDMTCVISKTFDASACAAGGGGTAGGGGSGGTHGGRGGSGPGGGTFPVVGGGGGVTIPRTHGHGGTKARVDVIPTGGGGAPVTKAEQVQDILNSPDFNSLVHSLNGAVKLAFEHYLENRILQIAAANGDSESIQLSILEHARQEGGLNELLYVAGNYLKFDAADCIGKSTAVCNSPLIKYTNAVGAKQAEHNLSFYLNALSWSSLGLIPLGLADKVGTDAIAKLAEDTLGSIITKGAIGAAATGGATSLAELVTDGHIDPGKVLLASLAGAATGAAPSKYAIQVAATAAAVNEFGDQLMDGDGVSPLKVLEAGAFGAVLGKLADLSGSDGAKSIQGSLAAGISSLCSNPVDGSAC